MTGPVEGPENVVIVGSGPAGYTAALYTARADLHPIVIEGFAWGGLLQQTTDVENYPGFPGGGVDGPGLMQRLRDQALEFGTRFVTADATRLDLAARGGSVHRVQVGPTTHEARAVILAMGAQHKKLGVPGEDDLAGAGVSYCATCDAAFFRDRSMMVVGGGDTAMEEAMFLAKFASKVTVVHRRTEFRASTIMLDRARAYANIEFKTPWTVTELLPGDGPFSRVARLRHVDTGDGEDVAIGGAFVAIGHQPQSQLVAGAIGTDEAGYVKVVGRSTATNLRGVFAAGDLTDPTYRQAITAAGSGCQAALDAERYLRDLPRSWAPTTRASKRTAPPSAPVQTRSIPAPEPASAPAGRRSEPITVYTTDACPYCVQVKQLLSDRGLAYTEINLARDAEGRAALVEKTGMMTFPQVLVGEVLVGGCHQTYAAERSGELDKLVSAQ